MNYQEFIHNFDRKFTEFCPCVIGQDGETWDCEKGHLMTLQEIYKERYQVEELPPEAMQMFYLIVKLQVIVVDYENQIYSDNISGEQQKALEALEKENLIQMHLMNIHGKMS